MFWQQLNSSEEKPLNKSSEEITEEKRRREEKGEDSLEAENWDIGSKK